MDTISEEQRSRNMSRIRSSDTSPEMKVRRLVHSMGYRFRLHKKELPGCPDIVFPGRKKIIFVHGCFWHMHSGCRRSTLPKTKIDYWHSKLKKNKERDAKNQGQLKDLGWDILIVWECETADLKLLQPRLRHFLEAANPDCSK